MTLAEPSSVLDHALRYAKWGFEVVPVYADKKYPLTPKGFLDASSDPEVIKLWWKNNPEQNIGIRVPSNLVVVDIDGQRGVDTCRAMGLTLPATLSASTPSGGFHHWYKWPWDDPAQRKIKLFDEVDLLTNGFVVAPPSKFGGRKHYSWTTWPDLSKAPAIAECPEWVRTTMGVLGIGQAKKASAEVFIAGVAEGQRNVSLFAYACSLRGRPRFSLAEAKVLVREAALKCSPPYLDWEYIVDKVWERYPAGEEDGEDKEVKIWTLAELAKASLPAPRYYAWRTTKSGKKQGLLRAGVGVITSDPKVGKSALISRWALAVAEGERIWGEYETERSGVLYLDLEQEDNESKERWSAIIPDLEDWPANLHVAFEWPRIDKGGMKKLRKFIEDHPYVGLVVVDTLADIWPENEGDHGNAYNREQQSVMAPLNKLASELGICILMVTHNRKGSLLGKAIESATGSMAISGKSKMYMVLNRNEYETRGFLKVTGKGIPERTFGLTYFPEEFRWELNGPEAEK